MDAKITGRKEKPGRFLCHVKTTEAEAILRGAAALIVVAAADLVEVVAMAEDEVAMILVLVDTVPEVVELMHHHFVEEGEPVNDDHPLFEEEVE